MRFSERIRGCADSAKPDWGREKKRRFWKKMSLALDMSSLRYWQDVQGEMSVAHLVIGPSA